MYRSAIALRRERGLGCGTLEWKLATKDVLHFDNGGVRVVTNFGPHPLPMPHRVSVLLASEPDAVIDDELAPNCTAWLA